MVCSYGSLDVFPKEVGDIRRPGPRPHRADPAADPESAGTAQPTTTSVMKPPRSSLSQRSHRRRQEFLRFLKLKHLVKAYQGQDLHLVGDNYAMHKSTGVNQWLAANLRSHVHFTPTGASWMNMIENLVRHHRTPGPSTAALWPSCPS